MPPAVRHLASVLRWAALALAVFFLTNVLIQLLPPLPGSASWQLSFCETLINQSPLLVMALCLQQLGGWLNEGSPRARRWAGLGHRLALPLAIGCLLLIPLQGFASWTAWQSEGRTGAQQAGELRRGMEELRRLARRAGSEAELAAVLRRLPGGGPAPASLGPDLASQRQKMLQGLDQAASRLDEAVKERRRQGLLSGMRRFVRLLLSALALTALLLAVDGRRWRLPRPSWIGRRRRGRGAPASGAYLRQLAREQQAP